MIFATRCAGCQARGPVLCRTCRFALVARPAPGAPSGIVVATAYSGRVRDVLLGLKYHNRRLVAAHVAGVLAGRLAGRAAECRRRDVGADERVAAPAARVRPGRADRPRRRRPPRAALPPPARARRAAARAQTGRSRRQRLSGPRFRVHPRGPGAGCSSSTTSSRPGRRSTRRPVRCVAVAPPMSCSPPSRPPPTACCRRPGWPSIAAVARWGGRTTERTGTT